MMMRMTFAATFKNTRSEQCAHQRYRGNQFDNFHIGSFLKMVNLLRGQFAALLPPS
jgi:hypothetical protein